MSIEKELKIVTDAIQNDRELFYGYQSNIAMAFYDAAIKYRKNRHLGNKYLTNVDIHAIANEGAINFLNLWIK